MNRDSDIGYVKFGESERNLQRIDGQIVNSNEDVEFYAKNNAWNHAADVVFFTPESNIITEIEQGKFDVWKYIERISEAEEIKNEIFLKKKQLDGTEKELGLYIDNLARTQELESDIEMLEGEIEELQEEEEMLEKAVEKETSSKDLKIISSDIASKKQDIREIEARLRRREGDVMLYREKYKNAAASYDRLDEVIRQFDIDYPDLESQRDAFKDKMRIYKDKKAQLKSKMGEVSVIRSLVDSTYENYGDSDISPFDNKPISLESLDERRKELRIKSADLASKMKYEDDQIKPIKAEAADVNNGIATQANRKRDRDRYEAEIKYTKKELDELQHLTDNFNVELKALEDDLKELQEEHSIVSGNLKYVSKDKLKSIQVKIGVFENEIKTKENDVNKLTRAIPDFIDGESLEDYTNKKNSTFEMLRNDVATLKEQYNKKLFTEIDKFNANVGGMCDKFGFKNIRNLYIAKYSSMDPNGAIQYSDTLSRMERMVLALIFQLSAREMYIPDFPFFVFDEDINAFDEATHKSILKYLSDKVEYVITSKSVDSNEKSKIIINHIAT
ncbi:MAG: hypothetical protein KAH86_04090 [Methanosarcinales archaeon]|nr:hypothetical protein [Methanosarcinales archaeon]